MCAQYVPTYTFSNGTTADGGQVETEKTALGTAVNSINNSQIASDAAIAISKLETSPFPWTVDVFPNIPSSSVTWGTNTTDSSQQLGFHLDTDGTGAINSELTYNVVLAAGTWTIWVLYLTAANRGIMSVQIDGVEAGTVDQYSASTIYNVATSITGVTVATNGKKVLKLKMTGKNAGSSAYAGSISYIKLLRTA